MPPRINLHELAKLSSAQRAKLQQRTETDLAAFEEKADRSSMRFGPKAMRLWPASPATLRRRPSRPRRLPPLNADFAEAEKTLDPKVREAMEFAAHSIRKFHQDQMPEEMWLHEIRPGAFAGDRSRPIPSVACYVPRGKGAFPSVALMTSIPAKVAGVKDVIIITPPGANGKIDDATLVAARMAGVSKVFKAGGAQGYCRRRLWHTNHSESGEGDRPRKPVGGRRQTPRVASHRYRVAGGAQRSRSFSPMTRWTVRWPGSTF